MSRRHVIASTAMHERANPWQLYGACIFSEAATLPLKGACLQGARL